MNKVLLMLFASVILHGCAHFGGLPPLQKKLGDFGIAIGGELKFDIQHTHFDKDFAIIEAQAPGSENRLAVTLFKNEDAALIALRFEEKISKLKSVYDSTRDPYFAVLTKDIKCDPRFLPQFDSKKVSDVFSMRAFGNSRSNLGACDSSTVKRKILVALIKCKNSLAEFQFSVGLNDPLEQYSPAVESLKCLE